MSEQPTAAPGGGKKIFGMPRSIVIIGGITFVAVLGYLWWKRAQTAAAATTASATTAASTQQQPTDYAGQLSVLQTELEALLAQQGTATTTTPPATTTTTPPAGTPVTVAVPDGTGKWMNASFPTQAAMNAFYTAIGVTNGNYPNGLNNAQITAAVQQAGGSIVSGTGEVLSR